MTWIERILLASQALFNLGVLWALHNHNKALYGLTHWALTKEGIEK